MTSLDSFFSGGKASPVPASAHRQATVTPVIFCGPGSNLYPLCDPSSSTSTLTPASLSEALPKALLPVGNRPLIAYPLQYLVSAGIKHAIVLAPANQHRALEAALKGIRLQLPHVPEGKGSTSKQAAPSDESNIVVFDGLSPAASAAKAADASADNVAMKVELLPLGPYDRLGNAAADEDSDENEADEEATKGEDEFRRISRPGTAELLRWIASIGKLEADPLVLPVDFVAPSLPLTSFLLSYYASCDPSPPTVATLLYERGAGEGVGREREKEGPARALTAFSHAHPSHLQDGHDTRSKDRLLSTHNLLLLSEPPSSTSASSSLDVRLSLFRKHPRALFTTTLLDSHVYILRRDQVVPLLKARRDLTSLREHVLPFIAKAGWQDGLAEKAGWTDAMAAEKGSRRPRADDGEDTLTQGAQDIAGPGGLMALAFERSSLGVSSSSRSGKSRDASADIRAITVVARLGKTDASQQGAQSTGNNAAGSSGNDGSEERFFARANTLPTYLECNRYLLRSLCAAGQSGQPLPFALASTISPSASSRYEISQSAQLSPDTLLPAIPEGAAGQSSSGESTNAQAGSGAGSSSATSAPALVSIADRVSLKRSSVSANVAIARSSRIAGSLLMEGCSIGDGSKLENCIIGPGAKVGERCVLKDVDLGPGARVGKGWEGRGEKIGKGEEGDEEGSESGSDED